MFGGGGAFESLFHKIVSVSNLLKAWNKFKKGKSKKKDIALFEMHLEDNIFRLHTLLITKTYVHDPYESFYVCDPKRRHIHKASVRDRVLHQVLFQTLYPIFDKHFIHDSYSSRNLKGTHAGVARLSDACRKISSNWKKPAYVLKCDVRKFFASIDHKILRVLIARKIEDQEVLGLIDEIFKSFENQRGKGLPLGNVTSQLFSNIYLNELDQFAKHTLKAKCYFRYCDDFVIVHPDKKSLEDVINKIKTFLFATLSLDLHPNKVEIRKVTQGVDFLGYVVLPYVQVVRTKTKRRLLCKLDFVKQSFQDKKISTIRFQSTISSYLGVLSHGRNKRLQVKVKRLYKQ